MTLNYAIWWFIQPSHLLIWLTLAALLTGIWSQGLSRRLLMLSASIWVAILFFPIGSWLILPLETRFSTPTLTRSPDGIILLAGSERPARSSLANQPHVNDHASRSLAFLDLARRYPDAELWFSGGGRETYTAGPMPSQAAVAERMFDSAGLSDRVRFDRAASSTCESAETMAPLLAGASGDAWLLVTSAFHMPRAVACFRAQDLSVFPYPTDFKVTPGTFWPSPRSTSLTAQLRALDLAAHEWIGLAYYRLHGLTVDWFPHEME